LITYPNNQTFAYDEQGHWRVIVSGVGDYEGTTMSVGDHWAPDSYQFVSTTRTHVIQFEAMLDTNGGDRLAYINLDGVSIQKEESIPRVPPVPSLGPFGIATLCSLLGLSGLAARRSRR
jgi:hypothetical protein